MANNENLIPYRFTSSQNREKAAAAGQKGGIASGKAKRAKKTMRELAKVMLDSKLDEKQAKAIKKLAGDLDMDDITVSSAILAGQIKAAIGGNTRAAEYLQSLVEQVETDAFEDDELTKSLEELAKKL